MKNKLQTVLIFLFILLFTSIFYRWFIVSEIIGGDWLYLYNEALREHPFFVPAWNIWQGNGMGGTNPVYFLQSYEYFTIFLSNSSHIAWVIIYKIFWFGLFLFFSLSTSIFLIKTIFQKIGFLYIILGALIYSTNTYILIVVGGGQMGVALAYSTAPLVLAAFIRVIDNRLSSRRKFSIIAGLVLALQVLFDPRISYLTMIAVGAYFVVHIRYQEKMRNVLYLIFYAFVVPGGIVLLVHAFWILPVIIFQQSSFSDLGSAYTGSGIVRFLSFANFSQSLSFLHPNWPENIFGKVYFMRAEFILLPLLAYASLFFIREEKQRKILFFALLGIVGAFLAKGANPPFGDVFIWLFEHVPGFVLFRDPTKFYLLVALSYSILIPYILFRISNKIVLITFLVLWLFLVRPVVFGELRGTFKKQEVPKEYISLKNFLYDQPDFFRTLWVPRQQRFTFFSNLHPSVEAMPLLHATNSAQTLKEIEKKGPKYFSDLSIKYVIVAYDPMGEIFQKDRKYDDKAYQEVAKTLKNISWLKKIEGFGKIQVFELPSVKDHIWLAGDGQISYKMKSPTRYSVSLSILHPQALIFSELYDSNWRAIVEGTTIQSKKTENGLNSFKLEDKKIKQIEIIYQPQLCYDIGKIISFVALIIIGYLLIFYHTK